MLPLSLLNSAKGHPVLIELKNGDVSESPCPPCFPRLLSSFFFM